MGVKVELTIKKMVQKAAKADGETVSTWIRDAVIKKLEDVEDPGGHYNGKAEF